MITICGKSNINSPKAECGGRLHFEGVENVTINQGVGIDLEEGVSAIDSDGDEVDFTTSPESIEKCDVGVHTVTYEAQGKNDGEMDVHVCGYKSPIPNLGCDLDTVKATRIVTITQAGNPVIEGIDPTIIPPGSSLALLSGVTATDDNGNSLDVTFSGNKDSVAEGDIATFETDLAPNLLKSLKVQLEPIQDLHGYDAPWVHDDNEQVPYKFRASNVVTEVGNSIFDKIVGGTVVWNQLLPDGTRANTNNGVSYTRADRAPYILNGTATNNNAVFLLNVSNLKATESHKYLFYGGKSTTVYVQLTSVAVWGGVANPQDVGSGKIANATKDGEYGFALIVKQGTTVTNESVNPQLFDLTAMFGTTIADYIYSLEQSHAGAGVAWFRNYFPKDYYPYDPGTLRSVEGVSAHEMVGFNQWDEEWEVGGISPSTGEKIVDNTRIRTKNRNPIIPNTQYYLKLPSPSTFRIYFYDADNNYLVDETMTNVGRQIITAPANACYYMFIIYNAGYGTTYNHDICINLSWSGTRNGEYEPYEKHSYPLDNSLTLRGIPKLDNGNLYYDGDEYASDGSVTRRYGVVDLGTLTWTYTSGSNSRMSTPLQNVKHTSTTGSDVINAICGIYSLNSSTNIYNHVQDKTIGHHSGLSQLWVYDSSYTDATAFKQAMSGVYLVYEFATPTTETAEPYTNPQSVEPYGTEEYVTTSIVPVGHVTDHANICPMTGYDSAKVIISPTEDAEDGTTYTTNLGRTVYGGTIDLVSGELVVDRAMVTFDGTESWTNKTGMSNLFSWSDSRVKQNPNQTQKAKLIASTLPTMSQRDMVAGSYGIAPFSWGAQIVVRIDGVTSAALAKNYFATNPTTVVYELDTPQTYQLDPQTIETLVGENNVWGDGHVTVVYTESIKSDPVDFPVEGTYAITYEAEDECGNKTTQTRMIYVRNQNVYFTGLENVTQNQGLEFDPEKNVHAYDGQGNEIEFTVTGTFAPCTAGTQTFTYTANGFSETRTVTVVEALPTIQTSDITIDEGEFNPLYGVYAEDGNGKELEVTYTYVKNLVYFPNPIGVGENVFDYVSIEPGTYTISFDLVGVEGQLENAGNQPTTIGWQQGQSYLFLPVRFTQLKRIDTGEPVWDDTQPITQRVYYTFTFDKPITQVSIALLSEFYTAGQIDNVWMVRGTTPY